MSDEPLPPRPAAEPHPMPAAIVEAHAAAIDAGLDTYRDPSTGWSVFTAAFLADRGHCCESGCRHCPFRP